jgi:ParB family transcriptional regulator, chromosome partitioning protein
MSSKAAALGKGASFKQTVSPRRAAINATTVAPTEGAPPPVELPVAAISLNPANPRSELGDLSELAASMRDHGQKTAISIMGRFSYTEANPVQADKLEPGTKYVVIDGNSRLAAAREAGLTTIKVMLDDELGSNPDELLESALVANVHRKDLDHLDEARALEQLLKVHGTQQALAARLHRSQPWVAQRLALLKLTPELRERLVSGEESADLLRLVGNKKPEQQAEHLARLKEQRAEDEAEKKRRAKERSAVKKNTAAPTPPAPTPPAPTPPAPDSSNRTQAPEQDRPPETSAAPSPESSLEQQLPVPQQSTAVLKKGSSPLPHRSASELPWESIEETGRYIKAHMAPEQWRGLAKWLLDSDN